MTAVAIAVEREWEHVLAHYGINASECTSYPYGVYTTVEIKGITVIFYLSGSRKVNASAGAQYMIDHFPLEKLIVIGTCAGVDAQFKVRDIIVPHRVVQVDTTVKELDQLVRPATIVDLDLTGYDFPFHTGIIGSGDKALVIWKDYLELQANGITAADTESASVAFVCSKNNIPCLIIRGISDFPADISYKEASDMGSRQIQNYLNNIPPIINDILDNYLENFL